MFGRNGTLLLLLLLSAAPRGGGVSSEELTPRDMEPKPMEPVGPPSSEGLSFEEWALEFAFDLTERREVGGVQQLHVSMDGKPGSEMAWMPLLDVYKLLAGQSSDAEPRDLLRQQVQDMLARDGYSDVMLDAALKQTDAEERGFKLEEVQLAGGTEKDLAKLLNNNPEEVREAVLLVERDAMVVVLRGLREIELLGQGNDAEDDALAKAEGKKRAKLDDTDLLVQGALHARVRLLTGQRRKGRPSLDTLATTVAKKVAELHGGDHPDSSAEAVLTRCRSMATQLLLQSRAAIAEEEELEEA
eukprot:COSAG04_NODE_2447_length_4104_cov_2.484894_2_plen_301_part_00